MIRQPTARLQLSAERFRLRRLEDALLGAGPDPGSARGPSPLPGLVLAALLTVGCTVLAWVRPHALDDAPIVMDSESGALYVRVGERVHPVLNLASARLIAATAAVPRRMPADVIARALHGPPLGIPGAPQVIGPAPSGAPGWSICDHPGDPATTTVLAGVDPPVASRLDPQQAMPVTSTSSGATYLLYRGQRIAMNSADPGLPTALRSAGAVPRRVSPALLDAIPEAVSVPQLPDRIAMTPDAATLCAHWRPDDPAGVTLSVQAGLPLPPGVVPVPLAQADADGPAVDAVYLPPGRSVYVRAVGVSGRSGAERYLISGTGVRFAVGDDADARSLGLPAEPSPAPWPMLAGLPSGPRLDRVAALLSRDVVPGTPAPAR